MSPAVRKVVHSRARADPRLISQLGGAPSVLHATTHRCCSTVIISVDGEVDASNEDRWEHLLHETVATALSYEIRDPEIHPDVVTGEHRYGEYQYIISNSFGFGKHSVGFAVGRS